MREFWETKFREIQTLWGLEPSDSAISTSRLFKDLQISDILIPGVGYGRNAKAFMDCGIKVIGIEISESAIKLSKEICNFDLPVYHGSVTQMPFDNKKYDGIFCYALIHLLNKFERRKFICNCFNQIKTNGYMIFVAVSKETDMYGKGRQISNNRFKITKGLNVYFYDIDSATREFKGYGLIDIQEIEEPVKHMDNEPPLKFLLITCKK